ncbi:hypothetical protein GQ607_003402 [Colletotrichum asianum]|uniref:Uncharacterized protein n=1 Tax=Colletotrichum asianum TaxID=702518 RepID=A0A8H3ZRU6_9PEZI|nr:hypothetical protein GQ607_003402 [Colletotrichum asianum]
MMDRRFFVLPEPLPPIDKESLLGRVVSSKTSPLDQFAPFPSHGTPPHNTNDILPAILPAPRIVTSFNETLLDTRQWGTNIRFATLPKTELNRGKQGSLVLECEELRRYVLPNPELVFQELMKNEHYASDVRELLEKVFPRDAYFVAGFIIATNSKWKIEATEDSKAGVNIAVPNVAEVGNVAVPGLLDVGGEVGASSTATRRREMVVVDDEIIAVSYFAAKLSYGPFWSAPFRKRVAIPQVGRAIRAKPGHLAMGDAEEEMVEWDSSDEETLLEGPARATCVSDRNPTGVKLEGDLE